MNPEELITHLADSIAESTKTYGGPLHICFWANEFQVLPALHTCVRHPVFWVIKDPATWEGLTNVQWYNLSRKLMTSERVVLKCLKQSKPLT